MKRKELIGLVLVLITAFIISCKSGNDKDLTTETKSNCEEGNKLELTISDYNYRMTEPEFEFISEDFEVLSAEYIWENDSMLSLKLMNYITEEDNYIRRYEDVDINVDLRTHDGETLAPGIYKYNNYNSTKWSRVMMRTYAGLVWFNRIGGMPEQGFVEIFYVSEDEICGNIELKVDKPEEEFIGTVILKGYFSYKKE